MCKKLITILAAVFVSLPAASAYAAQINMDEPKLRVVLENKTLELPVEPFFSDGEPYLPLRAVCEAMGASVVWNDAESRAYVVYKHAIYPVGGILKDDRMTAPLGLFKNIFKTNITYDNIMYAVLINRGEAPSRERLLNILPRYDGYNGDDVYWLSRIVEAEATGESYASRLAVANVILNRVANPAYPDIVKDVIFDRKHGVQFTPTANGTVYNTPSTLSYLAALDALEGRNNALGALFFMNPDYATNFWMQNNRQYAFTIGGHAYYY